MMGQNEQAKNVKAAPSSEETFPPGVALGLIVLGLIASVALTVMTLGQP